MGGRNLYLTYKKDTSRLLYWVINTSNGIVQSMSNAEDCAPVVLNTTGQSTVSEIVNMSKLIAKHVQPIPSTIFELFQAVIKARSVTYEVFRKSTSQKPDLETERSNATHKHFIDSLTEAFDALGGKLWSSNKELAGKANTNKEDVVKPSFQNQFSQLNLGDGGGDHDRESDESSDNDANQAQTKQKKKKPTGKGKKGKKGKRKKNSKENSVPKQRTDAVLAGVPIESYRIIMDKDGLVSDYLLAVYAVVSEWSALRSSTQDVWHEVAYDGLNGAVAASLTNAAVMMVKQTCLAVFSDFPDHESYDTIIRTLTRGDPDKAQGQFTLSLYNVSACGHQAQKLQETAVDVKEQFWVHAYNDLVAFITDFQKNRTGKPTKAMQAQISDWDPNYDLQYATKNERISWRRAYTINWLYDLVNVFSSIVVQRNTLKGEHHKYEKVDWSINGPWNQHRRLFGLNEFAGIITTLAMQKPSVDIRQKILPHHVFQLQCIVDSLTASRGWMLSPLRGHVLDRPAPDFHPWRDVDLFLDREGKRSGHGLIQALVVLKQVLEKEAELHEEPKRHEGIILILEEVKYDFVNCLGKSQYMYGLQTIPPSRFSKHNANGLWEYSPLLCAAGLVEGLVLAQRVTFLMWDQLPEVMLSIHLHNMLVQKGYIKAFVGLYGTLEKLLEDSFFPKGIPKSRFYDALVKILNGPDSRTRISQRQALEHNSDADAHKLFDISLNRFFSTKSTLVMYYDADWIPERIPDKEIRIPSMLYMVRLSETKRIIDPLSGETRLEETELVKRAKTLGQNDAALLQSSILSQFYDDPEESHALLDLINSQKDYTRGPSKDPYNVKENKQKTVRGQDLLDLIRVDLFHDVCGNHPLSSLNYIWITVHIMMLFREFEDKLKDARHPLYIRGYENAPPNIKRTRRAALIIAAIANEDDAAMKIFAAGFERMRMGAMGCIFWEDLRDGESGVKASNDTDELPLDQCSVM